MKPDALPREMFKVVGRAVWWDSGSVAVGFRMLLKVFDYGFFAALISGSRTPCPTTKRTSDDEGDEERRTTTMNASSD